MTTCALLAPARARVLLARSGDPIYDICNPPPVSLADGSEAAAPSPRAPFTDAQGSVQATPTSAYGVRSPGPVDPPLASGIHCARGAPRRAHHRHGRPRRRPQGVPGVRRTARLSGARTCPAAAAATTPLRCCPKKMGSRRRASSILTRASERSTATSARRESAPAAHPSPRNPSSSSDRILSWRQAIASAQPTSASASLDSLHHQRAGRIVSPRKSFGQISVASSALGAGAAAARPVTASPVLVEDSAFDASPVPPSPLARSASARKSAVVSVPSSLTHAASTPSGAARASLDRTAAPGPAARPSTASSGASSLRGTGTAPAASARPLASADARTANGRKAPSTAPKRTATDTRTDEKGGGLPKSGAPADQGEALRCRTCGGGSFTATVVQGQCRLGCSACGEEA